MKRAYIAIALFGIFCGFLVPQTVMAQFAFSEIETESKSGVALSSPQQVALLYYKYARKLPDFQRWVRRTKRYKSALDFNRLPIQTEMIKSLRADFGFLTVEAKIVVSLDLALSDYALENEGFVIEGLHDKLFFPVTFADENYALVPSRIMEYQWLSVQNKMAKSIDDLRVRSQSGEHVKMFFELTPRFASEDSNIEIEGTTYKLFAVDVDNIQIFDATGGLLWQHKKAIVLEENEAKILELYR